MRRSPIATLCFVLGAFFFLPAIDMCVRGPNAQGRTRLIGVETTAALPSLDLASFASGELQRGLDAWFAANQGLRSFFVRSDNQINFTLLGESSSSYGSRILVGAENTLFEEYYVRAYRGGVRHAAGRYAAVAKRLRRAQDRLAEQGKRMLVLISPAKPFVYPERLGRWAPTGDSPPTTDYDLFLPMLRAEGVRVFDAAAFLREQKATSPHPLFAKAGSHWSHYGACLVAAELTRRVGEELGRPVATIDCNRVHMRRKPRTFDVDLGALMNMWSKRAFYESLAYPIVEPAAAEAGVTRPRMLMIGSSFIWVMAEYLSSAEVFEPLSFLYYYNSKHDYAAGRHSKVAWRRQRWTDEVAPYDIVLLERSQAALLGIGDGFVERVIRR